MRSLVHRNYENVHALAEVSFHIAPGERVGFLGPNGAGKTTALKILSGLLYPTSGKVTVDGFTPHERRVEFLRAITLVMGQKQQLMWDLPPAETFAMNRALFDLPRHEADAIQNELVELLQVGPLLGKPCRQLSLGERMKCELVAALLHRPKVLFLDEPTIGLDVSMQAQLRDFIRRHNEATGATILLTSHYMADVAALCPRVVVIDKGHLIYDGDLKTLARRIHPEKRITLHFASAQLPGGFAVIAPTRSSFGTPKTEMNIVAAMSGKKPSSDDSGNFSISVDRSSIRFSMSSKRDWNSTYFCWKASGCSIAIFAVSMASW